MLADKTKEGDEPEMIERGATRTGRWSRETWIELGVRQLKSGGPGALRVEALCAAAQRTRGSFYHHFPNTETLLMEIAQTWRRTETDEIGEVAVAQADPRKGLRALARRAAEMDHGLEIGVRALALESPDVAAIVRAADETRESIISNLVARAYGLSAPRAAEVARLFHSVQLAGQIRAPDDVGSFSAGPARLLTALLEASAK